MRKRTKVLTLSLLAVLLFAVVLPFSVIFADEISTTGLDGTSIYEDLKDAKILGETFDFDKYKPNEHGSPELLAFVEFGFSLIHEYQKCYGLYLYIYFPQGNLIDSEQNQVNFAMRYNGSDVVEYGDLQLKLISKDAYDVLYKFKVVDSKKHKVVQLYERVAKNSEERIYEINGIELFQKGKENAVEYGVGGTWTITGYGKDMHESSMEESTLQSVATFKNTLKLEVSDTYYRYWYNNSLFSNNDADQVSSVYFSVPKTIAQKFDYLESIHFNAYEAQTSPIFVIYEEDDFDTVNERKVYENLSRQVGLSQSEVLLMPEYTWLKWDYRPSFLSNPAFPTPKYQSYYCEPNYSKYSDASEYATNYEKLSWLFQVSSSSPEVSKTELKDWMISYSSNRDKDILNKYSSDLFSGNPKFIDKSISRDADFPLIGSSVKENQWERIFDILFSNAPTGTEPPTFNPIVEVSYSDIVSLNDYQISENYLVAEEDVANFRNHLKTHSDNYKTYLFRFDVSTYFSSELWVENYMDTCGYQVSQTVFLDFDIISLTYEKAGVKTVIPVVSSPIDIIAGIEPPSNSLIPEFENWWKTTMTDFLTTLFGTIAIALFLFLVLRFLEFVFKKK